MNTALNGNPNSANEWFEIVEDHPEFFKFNQRGDTVVLIIRSCLAIENEKQPTLSIDQTQKLIDQAISLHDKEILRLQKNSFLIPIATAIIAALTTGIITFITLGSTSNNIIKVEERLKNIENILENKVPKK